MTHEQYMFIAFEEAFKGIRNDIGGPFGAIIVLHNEIIGRGRNMVTAINDPTAHAEIVAIREACKNNNTFHLEDAIIYSTCEPCPMCLSAIYWADIKSVYYTATKYDAEKIGFSDNLIYTELGKPIEDRIIKFNRIELPESSALFTEWRNKDNKITY